MGREIKKIVVISPHPDDAIFSVGGFLIKSKKKSIEIDVLDIFNIQTYSVRKSNLQNSIIEIENEERKIMNYLGFNLEFLNFKEAGLRGFSKLRDILGWDYKKIQSMINNERFYNELNMSILNCLSEKEIDLILLPLGVGGHIDHILVRELVLNLIRDDENINVKNVMFYEELPYSINPEWLFSATLDLECIYGKLVSIDINIDKEVDLKRTMIDLYKSQIKEKDIKKIIEYGRQIKINQNIERLWLINV